MSPKGLSLISTLVNLGLTILKFAIGIFSQSIALIAEALHSGLDVISSLITFWGLKTAEKPADIKHPYGRERYESLASFVVVLLLFVTAFWILFEAIKNIVTEESLAQFTFWGIIVMGFSTIINEIMARLKFSLGNKLSSLVLVADAEHSRADVISSLVVLLGLVAIKVYPLADSILASLVALYIFYKTYNLSRESIDSLVDTANPELEEKIKRLLEENKFRFKTIKTRKIGLSNFAEISLLYDPQAKMDEVTALTKRLEEKLLASIPELKQVSLLVKSHDFGQAIIRPRFGGRLRLHRGFEKVGPEKLGKRITIPLENGEIASQFGAAKYLVIDVDEKNKVVQKTEIENPYYEAHGPGRGTKFMKSIEADKVITKQIGEGAKQNLETQGIEIDVIDKNKTLKDLDYD